MRISALAFGVLTALSPSLAAAQPEALRADGGVADWWELPKLGVTGNGHMMMMDKNSDQVAQLVQRWLTDKGMMQ